MKNTQITLLFTLFSILVFAQDKTEKHINVTGSATIEIVPDEINLEIEVKEYWKEEFENKKVKKFKTKVSINEIENRIIAILSKNNINKEDVVISKIGNYGRNFRKEFLIGKQYLIKLNSFNKIAPIVNSLEFKDVKSINIASYDHSRIIEYRKQVKIDAIKAAKDKATYLVEAIGEKLGKVITISEVNNDYYSSNFIRTNAYSNNISTTQPSDSSDFNSKKIKLRYEINVKFAIQ
ncbi:SIMPL domain-containing protein [Pseudofulvibacter geojedonensis]|uniref:SIMPL domain-containing protein n=2 Tax=Pseudofulvibacter geojedonensis TaxID=1123758 RepID=A0ABW3I3V9_9FLAO